MVLIAIRSQRLGRGNGLDKYKHLNFRFTAIWAVFHFNILRIFTRNENTTKIAVKTKACLRQ